MKNLFRTKGSGIDLPPKASVASFAKQIAVYLFPVIEGGGSKALSPGKIKKHLLRLLDPLKKRLPGEPSAIAETFLAELPSVKRCLDEDAAFLAANDPAATGTDEVIMAYPGFYTILIYRVAHTLLVSGVPVIPRIMTEHAHSLTGIDIHPGAAIGSEFFIDHGTGIVIGESTVIGNRVKLYQGVTLGALSVTKSMASSKRHPTIEDDVIIYAGSTILGGNTVIGHDSIIGGNVWLTESVPPFSMVSHQHQVTIRDRNGKDDKK